MLEVARGLTQESPEIFEPRLRNFCAASGVAWVLVPELPGTHIHGATQWLSPTKALIQLSLRYKSNDQLWFSFFHEAGHILLHGKKEKFLEENGVQSEKEDEANRFAADKLIPRCRTGSSLLWVPTKLTRESGVFSDHIGIAPGIVVGRLQFDKHLPPSHLNDLKVRLDWVREN